MYLCNIFSQATTFQLILATDFVQTQAYFIYEVSNLNLQSWQRVVVGYDARDFTNYHYLQLPFPRRLDLTEGNTGRVGVWHFRLSLYEFTAEQRCLQWANRQQRENYYFSRLRIQFCPCTINQAQRDWKYWFGYYSGLSSHPNCATILLSGNQRTIECCYNKFGALITGPYSRGGSFKRYNPLFFHRNNLQQDVQPYLDCCVHSNRCQIYYANRRPTNCSGYQPPNFSK